MAVEALRTTVSSWHDSTQEGEEEVGRRQDQVSGQGQRVS